MAAYSYGSSYESVMKKNCGYRQLGNYYNNLFDNITTDNTVPVDKKVPVIPMFGGVGYNKFENFTNPSSMSMASGNGTPTPSPHIKCNTWRMGQCCDGRSLNKDAYTQCVDGMCGQYVDERGKGLSLYARY